MDDAFLSDRALRYGDFAIGLRCAAAAPLRWLEEFLTPWFEPSAREDSTWLLDVVIDSQAFDSLINQRPVAPPREIDCFTLDGGFDRRQVLMENDVELLIRDSSGNVVYRIHQSDQRVVIFAPDDGVGLRMAMMRVVRELATLHSLRAGHLHVHGSALVAAGSAIVFCGPKCSGKSTTLLQALHTGGFEYLSNDRLLISDPDYPQARGMPTIVQLRIESLERMPLLHDRIRHTPLRFFWTMQESVACNGQPTFPIPPRSPTSLGISPAQFCRLLGVNSVPAAPIRAIVFTEVDAAASSTECFRLSSDKATELLLQQGLLSPGAIEYTAAFCAPCERTFDSARRVDTCRRLFASTAAYRCRLANDLFENPSRVSELLNALLKAPAGDVGSDQSLVRRRRAQAGAAR